MPIRSFSGGKSRLYHLTLEARATLLRYTAEAVVRAAGDLPVAVVTNAAEVRAWAVSRGVVVLDDPGCLNEAASAGHRWAAELGASRAVVVHADLPLAHTFLPLTRDGLQPVVTAVPCHRDDGTPALSLPTGCNFQFAYGPGSFRRHAAEARRVGLGFRVIRDPLLGHDLDVPGDLSIMSRPWDNPITAARSA